jgi:hypothetical protein
MNVSEFREKIKSNVTLQIGGKDYEVRQVIRFKFDDGIYYIKCFLNNGYVLADDLDENSFILVRETTTPFEPPFPKELEFLGTKFNFLYEAHAIAEETWGEEIFEKGKSERFWDYQSENGKYLSLGVIDSTNQRLDFYGEIIPATDLRFK